MEFSDDDIDLLLLCVNTVINQIDVVYYERAQATGSLFDINDDKVVQVRKLQTKLTQLSNNRK